MAIVELDKIRTQLAECEKPMNRIRKSLDMEGKKRRIEEIEVIMEEPGFWDDVERSTKSMGELKSLKDALSGFETLEKSYEEIGLLIDMAEEEHDESLLPEIEEEFEAFLEKLEEMRMTTLLSGEYDANDAIVRLNAGAGGTEACDWCSMLYRMYTRWA